MTAPALQSDGLWRCDECVFWALAQPGSRTRPARGHCRRHAPRGPAEPCDAPFALTAADQACGEHRPRSWPDRLAQMEEEEGALHAIGTLLPIEWARLPPARVPTLRSRMTSEALCRANGWDVGTMIAAPSGRGGVILGRISALGNGQVLMRALIEDGEVSAGIECPQKLQDHDWRKVTP